MVTFHLFAPSLFWYNKLSHEIYQDLTLPTLEILLAKATHTKKPAQEIEAWLCQAFGITKQQNWPVAPIMLETTKNSNICAYEDYWLRADPVHFRVEQNHILLADSQAFQITTEESRLFSDILNQHFAKDMLTFLPLDSDCWYLRVAQAPDLQMHSLGEVAGRNINNLLPFGKDSTAWHNISNEIQMLLHEHPINEARQLRNELAINGIWFWGGGIMPKDIHTTYTQIWSNDTLAYGLALSSKTKHTERPLNAEIWQKKRIPGSHLVIFDELRKKTQYNDIFGWRENFNKLEQDWLKPLYIALKEGQIDKLIITDINEHTTKDLTLTRTHLKKFWHRTKPLLNYIKP